MLRRLGIAGMFYGAATTVAGLFFLFESFGSLKSRSWFFFGAILLGGVSQLIYGMKALSLLNFKAFKETDSLDNNLLFGEGEVIENSGFHIFLAVIASFVALVVLLLSALNFQRLFDLNFYSNADVMRSIFYWSNVIGAAPALIFNLRTWNLRVIRN